MISDSLPERTPGPEPASGAPSSTASARPRWLIPVVLAVIARAAVIGVVAGITLNTQRTGGSAAAGYVPADAVLYAEVRLDLPGDQRANLRAFLGHFSQVDPDKYLTDAIDAELDTAMASSGYRYSTDVKPWFDGRLAAAVLGLPSMTGSAGSTQIPDALVLAGVRDSAAATSLSDRLRADAAKNGATITSSTHGGATIWTAETKDARGTTEARFSWTITSDEVVGGTTPDAVGRALDVHGGQPSLADRTEFRDGVARLPADRAGMLAIDTAGLVSKASQELASAAPSAAAAVDDFLKNVPTYVVESAAFGTDRLLVDTSSLMPGGATIPANRDRGLAAAAPSDAILFVDGGDVGKGLSAVVKNVTSAMASSGLDPAQLDQVEAALGGDLSSFVSWIGDAAFVAGATNGVPWAGVIATPTDASAARMKLLQLQGLLQLAAGQGGPKVSVSDADHNGTRITTLSVAAGSDVPAWATTFQYAVTDTRVVIGMGETFVARVLDMTSGASLAAQSRFRQAVDALGGASNAGMAWLDLAALRQAIEPMLPSDIGPTYQSQVKAWVAPFDAVAAVSRTEGQRVESHIAIIVK